MPSIMRRLDQARKKPLPMSEVSAGKRSVLAQLRRDEDFQGCYLLLERGKPFYAGISRKVVGRLTQHAKRECHYSASLVFKMARKLDGRKMKRADSMEDADFLKCFRS